MYKKSVWTDWTDVVYKEMLYTCYNEGRIQIQFHRCFTL